MNTEIKYGVSVGEPALEENEEIIGCGEEFSVRYILYAYAGRKEKVKENRKLRVSVNTDMKLAYTDMELCKPDLSDAELEDQDEPVAGLELVEALYEEGKPFKTRVLAQWCSEGCSF